ncbi:MAG: type IV toxin-antitoxin system AbiEi family antitoxin domain-containing protein [Actinobacteria bacterium]|nr:type IV toxin-antitoxin system AbiEi family antitoxin domain-containing protein [Actinomycetota bacterium]
MVARAQLLELGMSPEAIRRRIATGRLHRVHQGVYAVGRKELGRHGELMAAVLACGPGAQLSHRSGAELWGICPRHGGPIDIAVPTDFCHRRTGIRSHRQNGLRRRYRHRIPVGDPISILIDLAGCLDDGELEDAVNEADRRNLVATPRLRSALDGEPLAGRRGAGLLRRLLDSQTFSRAQNALERRFLAIVRAAGLPAPDTQRRLGRYRVDFFWPDLGFVVETDSLRHHRTAGEQAVDLGRDQAHVRAGLRTLRFTHSQVFHRPAQVREILTDAFRHL